MLRSMTGYGKDSFIDEFINLSIEIKGINNRYLDINVRLPKSLFFLEDRIRRKISQSVKRGRIDVFISFNNLKRDDLVANLNENLLYSYLSCLNMIKEKSNIEDEISLSNIIRLPEIITLVETSEDLSSLGKTIENSVERSLRNFLAMKNEEGTALQKDIAEKCKNIKNLVAIIEERSPKIIEDNKNKLRERILESLSSFELDNNRLYQEFCYMADKLSIDEEIVRLKCHIESFLNHINKEEGSGKKMDFIVQEMNRETNTIGSKCNNIDVINIVIEIKSELEKIREQIQNIE